MYLLQISNFSYLYANKINIEFKIIIILLFLFTSLNSAISSVYIANKKIINVNLIIVIFSFISFIIYILFYKIYFLQDQNKLSSLLKVAILIQFLQLVILLIGVNKIKNRLEFTLKSKPKYLEILIELFSFSFLIYLTNLLAFFTYKVDIWFLEFYKGSSSVGVYSLSVMFAQIVWLIPNAISSIHLAEIVSNKTDHQIKITLLSLKISFYSALLIGILIYLFSYFFIVSIFGEKFNNVPNIILILFIGVIPFSSMPIISSYLAGVNNYKNNFIISFVVCFITFLLDIFLIPIYGLNGAAIASSISYILGAVLLTSYFLKITNLKLKYLYSLTFSDINLFFKNKII
jgi:O-antigen/teichoic acid export membrane protein